MGLSPAMQYKYNVDLTNNKLNLSLMLGSSAVKFRRLLVNAQISGVEWVYNHLNV